MKSKILFTQKEYIGSPDRGKWRWVRATLVDHAPVPGSGRHAHVLTLSVDDGDTHTWYESRTLLPVQSDALSIREAIRAFDELLASTKTQMREQGIRLTEDIREGGDDDLAF